MRRTASSRAELQKGAYIPQELGRSTALPDSRGIVVMDDSGFRCHRELRRCLVALTIAISCNLSRADAVGFDLGAEILSYHQLLSTNSLHRNRTALAVEWLVASPKHVGATLLLSAIGRKPELGT